MGKEEGPFALLTHAYSLMPSGPKEPQNPIQYTDLTHYTHKSTQSLTDTEFALKMSHKQKCAHKTTLNSATHCRGEIGKQVFQANKRRVSLFDKDL